MGSADPKGETEANVKLVIIMQVIVRHSAILWPFPYTGGGKRKESGWQSKRLSAQETERPTSQPRDPLFISHHPSKVNWMPQSLCIISVAESGRKAVVLRSKITTAGRLSFILPENTAA